ncbi:MAG: hypothetical protein HW421_2523 [Ignavibacteria bacterium]|nr:hypothetical protein [Ignavibacteria bacterium]
MITQYFADFGNIVNGLDFVLNSEIHIRKINDFLGVIETKLTFEFGVLDILEVIKLTDNQISKKKYKYHFRRPTGEMIFRYDNAPHHQNVATFPHHKHLESVITESIEPEIVQILAEIKAIIIENND